MIGGDGLKRTLIGETGEKTGEVVRIFGWVSVRRDHGKIVFIDLRDRSGSVQLVVVPGDAHLMESVKDVRSEFALEVTGLVKARPGKSGEHLSSSDIEIEVRGLAVISRPTEDLPIDVSDKELHLNLDTLLNNRTIALRSDKVRAVFSLYSILLEAYDFACRQRGFMEVKTPKILLSATEGGANFFKIKYFDREAFLAQSPQFYKQAGVSAFERVFEIGTVFRAEPHFTTRHVNEYTGLDGEMAFISGAEEVMTELEGIMMDIVSVLGDRGRDELNRYQAAVPPMVAIPRIRLSEAVALLKREYGKEIENEDIDAEGERMIGEYVSKTFGSDFVFLTHYPTALRPFYSMPSKEDPKYTETFDLIFRGVEIASGGQRIHEYQQLLGSIEARGMDPETFKDYLDIFKYGVPPHGGWGLGSERIIQKLLGLGSIKEAVLFPRDVKRLTP
jgi:nondiscriminating aspartyl-tRNA synthetase